MFFHTCSALELDKTNLSIQDLATLLLVSLAEIHANSEMFGGQDSISFKSKWKQIDRRGNRFCLRFVDTHQYCYVITRNNLSDSQKAVQSGHCALEISRKFNITNHPSLIYLVVKSEEKLKRIIEELLEIEMDIVLFREPDLSNEITAIGTKPLSSQEREIFKKYQLLQ